MARQLSAVPDIDSPDASYPAGRIRNDNPPTDGTPVIEELYGDITQFFHKLMRLAGISYSDLPDNEINGFDFVDALIAKIRATSGTTSLKGSLELATNAETQGGSDNQRAITPAGLESKTATETRKGIAELATNTETQTGTDTEKIVTPAGLESKTATTTRKGIAELATNTEVQTGTDTEKIVTPSGLESKTATETRKGIAEVATQTEIRAESDNERMITPAGLVSKIKAGMYVLGDVASGGTNVVITHNMGFPVGNYVALISPYTPNSQPGDNDIGSFRVIAKGTNDFTVRVEESASQVQDLYIDWCVMPLSL